MLDQRPVHWPPAAWIHWTQTAPASHLHQPTDNYTTIPHLHQPTDNYTTISHMHQPADNYTTISNNVTADTPALVSHAKAAFSVVATWLSLHQNTSHCHLGYCNTLLYSSGFKKNWILCWLKAQDSGWDPLTAEFSLTPDSNTSRHWQQHSRAIEPWPQYVILGLVVSGIGLVSHDLSWFFDWCELWFYVPLDTK